MSALTKPQKNNTRQRMNVVITFVVTHYVLEQHLQHEAAMIHH
jgi:hypothetical protein